MATNDVVAPHPARKHTPMPARSIAPSPLERQVGALTDTLVSILCAEAELSTADPNVSAIDAAIRICNQRQSRSDCSEERQQQSKQGQCAIHG